MLTEIVTGLQGGLSTIQGKIQTLGGIVSADVMNAVGVKPTSLQNPNANPPSGTPAANPNANLGTIVAGLSGKLLIGVGLALAVVLAYVFRKRR